MSRRRRPGLRPRDREELAAILADTTAAVQDANRQSREDALSGADSYVVYTRGSVDYSAQVKAVRENDEGQEVSRDIDLDIHQEYEVVRAPTRSALAPFELVNGVLGPAETRRHEIEELLSRFGRSGHPALFKCGDDRYWAAYTDGTHCEVQLGDKGKAVVPIETIERLNEVIRGMVTFISEHAADVHGV